MVSHEQFGHSILNLQTDIKAFILGGALQGGMIEEVWGGLGLLDNEAEKDVNAGKLHAKSRTKIWNRWSAQENETDKMRK